MKVLQYPVLAAFIFVGWLVLADHITPGQVLLAVVAAVSGVWMMSRLRLGPVSLRSPATMVRLAYYVTYDIIRSNFAVARIILKGSALRHSNFLIVPLEMKNRAGLALLAVIITATPGTIWVSYNSNNGRLILHILDLIDENQWMATIKNRYERLLMEIFE